jgi:SAM-dependent methyltransferase
LETPFILKDLLAFRAKDTDHRLLLSLTDLYPIVGEKTKTTGFDRHYVYHTAWAARVVQEIAPALHVDISSSLYFSGIVSAFVPVHFYDYRPAELELSGLESHAGDLMHLPFEDKSVQSISCLHTIEHVGLGRYGDPIDPEGDKKALSELKRVVAPGGSLLLVVPLGVPRIEYNAHRIYSYHKFTELVLDSEFSLHEYAYIPQYPEEGPMIRFADKEKGKDASYACGCFWFKRN